MILGNGTYNKENKTGVGMNCGRNGSESYEI